MNEHNFIFEITGRPLTGNAVEALTRRTQRDLLRVDPEVKLATLNFARLYYKLSWQGVPKNLHKLTIAKRNLINSVGDYMEEWECNIEVSFKEGTE